MRFLKILVEEFGAIFVDFKPIKFLTLLGVWVLFQIILALYSPIILILVDVVLFGLPSFIGEITESRLVKKIYWDPWNNISRREFHVAIVLLLLICYPMLLVRIITKHQKANVGCPDGRYLVKSDCALHIPQKYE